MSDSYAYTAVIKAVNGRWRRRFFSFAHLFIAVVVLFQVAYTTSHVQTFMNFETGLEETFTYTLDTRYSQTPAGIIWLVLVGLHLLYFAFAELRDRAIRREIERERKWHLIERLDTDDPHMRDRAIRLADSRDDELIDLESALRKPEFKPKRG